MKYGCGAKPSFCSKYICEAEECFFNKEGFDRAVDAIVNLFLFLVAKAKFF